MDETGQRIDVAHAAEAFAACQNNGSAGSLPFELAIPDQILQTIVHLDSKPGNETITKTRSHKVAQGLETCGMELSKVSATV